MKKRFPLLALLSQREPALLITGQTISNFGDGVALVALTLLILDRYHSASMLAWFAAARMIPLVAFILIGGAIVDRFSRRVLLLISDAMRAVLTGALAVLLVTNELRYWELIIFGVLFGVFDALFMPAITSITPEIVPEDLLPAMNAVRPLSSNLVGNMIGPAVGGVIAAFSTSWAIGIDAGTFIASASFLFLMRPTPPPTRSEGTSMVDEIRSGLRYVRSNKWIWTTLVSVTFVNALVFVPMSVLIPFFLRHTLHTSSQIVGISFAVSGLSGALGALLASNVKVPRRRIRVMWTYWLLGTLAALIIGVATNYWEVFLFPLLASPGMILGNVIWESMIQSEVPRELLGRVTSVDWFLSLGLSPVGLVAAGSLASAIGVRTYFVAAALFSSVPGVMILLSRRVNEIDRERVNV
jgi:MFS family permease